LELILNCPLFKLPRYKGDETLFAFLKQEGTIKITAENMYMYELTKASWNVIHSSIKK